MGFAAPNNADGEGWAILGDRLRLLPPGAFAPWRDYDNVVQWLSRQHPSRVIDCPDPVFALYGDDGRVMDVMLRKARPPNEAEMNEFLPELVEWDARRLAAEERSFASQHRLGRAGGARRRP